MPGTIIKPQYAVQRLYEACKDRETYITTEVGQHQMWAAQYFKFEEPNRWMTSGGLGTMGYGLPAAIGTQLAHPNGLVIDIAGEASILMNIQELSTAVQYRLPVKIFILNNEYMGMVRQWQELLHGSRYSQSYSESLPDFVKLAEAYGAKGMRCEKPGDLDAAIAEMLAYDGPVIFDCVVDKTENCFPMIPSGKAHNEMLCPTISARPGSNSATSSPRKARCWSEEPARGSQPCAPSPRVLRPVRSTRQARAIRSRQSSGGGGGGSGRSWWRRGSRRGVAAARSAGLAAARLRSVT